MSVSLYDLLNVEPQATGDEIRTAWRSAIADLDPSDRRFRAYNEAAETLLDADRRAEYDATLVPEPDLEPEPPSPTDDEATSSSLGAPRTGWVPPGWLVAMTAMVALALVGVAAWAYLGHPRDAAVDQARSDAETSAAAAAVAIFSYDYHDLEASHAAAAAQMTSAYLKKYDSLWQSAIVTNAPRTQTVVEAEFQSSGVVRAGEGRESLERVDVLVCFVQMTSNKQHKQAEPSPVFATLKMVKVDGTWLVDDVIGPPVAG